MSHWTTALRDAIPNPKMGDWIYNHTTAKIEVFNGSVWLNACLIDAAPDLLAASKHAIEILNAVETEEIDAIEEFLGKPVDFRIINLAIAKAEGWKP